MKESSLSVPQAEALFLLSEDLIDQSPATAMEVLGYSSKLGLGLGWHYLLDLTWVLDRLALPPPARILDAGGDQGLLQYILALRGHQVVSADALIRDNPQRLEKLVRVKKSGSQEALDLAYTKHRGGAGQMRAELTPARAAIEPGEVEFHCCDLEHLEHVSDNEFDAVVSISALEHNPPDKVKAIMGELRRVAKNGAPMLITISMAEQPRLDEPSLSWLLDEAGVVEAYGLAPGYQTNCEQLPAWLEKIQESPRLARWLGAFHFHSGKNGMPWGVWKPTYLPAAMLIFNRQG